MPKVYSGRILMNIKSKGQSNRSTWSTCTIHHSLLAIPVDVIGRLYYMIVVHPGHFLYYLTTAKHLYFEFIMSPPPPLPKSVCVCRGGGGVGGGSLIVFGTDPIGVGVKLLVRSVTWIPFRIFWWYLVEM